MKTTSTQRRLECLPKTKMPSRDYATAAECRVEFDVLVDRLRAHGLKPRIRMTTFEDELIFSNRYRYLCLRLTTGRYATLTQTEMDPDWVEIGLEAKSGDQFHEEDLNAIIDSLGIPSGKVKRTSGVQWIAAAIPKEPPKSRK